MKIRVLLVDDESSLHEMAKAFLEKDKELAVETALSADEALERLKNRSYDAIVSDYQMPGMDGVSFLKALRSAGDGTPFILFTGRGREDVAIDALNSGASFYLQKGGDVKSQFAELINMIKLSVQNSRSEEVVRASENMLSAIIEQSPISTWIASADGTNIRQNEACRRLFGIERDEQTVGVYNIFKDLVLKEQGHMPAIEAVFREGKVARLLVDYDFSRVKTVDVPNARHRLLQGTIFPVKDKSGKVVNAVVQHEDVTDHFRMEKSLSESEDRCRALLDEAWDMAFLVGDDGKISYANRASAEYLGRAQLDLVGKSVANLFPPSVVPGLLRDIRNVISKGLVLETEMLLPSRGKDVWVRTRLIPHKDSSGKADGVLGISKDVTDAKTASDVIRASEEKFTKVFMSGPQLMVISSLADGRAIDVNESFEKMTGFSRDQVIGKTASEVGFIRPEDAEKISALVLKGSGFRNLEARFRTKAGDDRVALMSAEAVTVDGEPCMISIVADITEMKAAEDALRQSEDKFSRAFRTSPTMMAIFTADEYRLVDANDRFFQVNELSREDAVGRLGGELGLISPETIEAFAKELAAKGKLKDVEVRYRTRSGDWLDGLFSAEGVSIYGKQCVLVHISDVSELKKLERFLKQTSRTLESIIDTSPSPIIVVDNNGMVSLWSKAAEELFGWKAAEVLGRPNPIVTKASAAEHQALLDRVRMGEVVSGLDIVRHKRDSSPIDLSLSTAALRDDKGDVIGIMGVVVDITERKKAEDALFRTTKTLESFFMASPLPIIGMDGDGNVTLWSRAAESMFGWKSEEVLGKTNPVVPRSSYPRMIVVLEKILQDKKPVVIEESAIARDGRRLELRISSAPLVDESGNAFGVMSVSADITEQKRRDAELREAHERRKELEAIVEMSPAVAFLWEQSTGLPVVFASANVRQFGYSPEDFTSRRIAYADIVHPDDLKRIVDEIEAFAARGVFEYSQEYRIVTKAGEVRWVDDRSKVRRDESGKSFLHEGLVMDITERKRAQEALFEAEARFQAFMSHYPAISYMRDLEGRYIYVNKAYLETFRRTLADVKGKTIEEVWPPETAASFRKVDDLVMQGNKPIEVIEIADVDGKPHEYLSIKFPILNESGGPVFLGGVSIDITEQRRTEKALRQANKKLNLLGSVTRHDAVNQLSVLFAWIDLAKESVTERAIMEALLRIQESARTLQRQLEFTADYQEMGIHQPSWFNLSERVETGIEGIDLKGVDVVIELKGVKVFADQMIEKVFHNLVENSLRHGQRVTTVRLHAEESEDGLTVLYEDDGVGIPAEDKENIFERGFGKHTGLGLYMAREILGITGITIRETGEAGKGARFEMHVPAQDYWHKHQ